MNVLQKLFGAGQTEAQRLRKYKNSLTKTIRELEREEAKLGQQEKKLTVEIKKNAKEGHMNAAKIQAKDLVRTRKNMEKFANMRIQVRTLEIRLSAMGANVSMNTAMADAGKVLRNMNRNSNLASLQRIAMDFERESTMMEQRQEIMDDAMDEATGVDDEDEQEDEILDKVLEEIGVNLKYSMGETPQGLQGTAIAESKVAQAVGGGDPGDDDLQARLNGLRR